MKTPEQILHLQLKNTLSHKLGSVLESMTPLIVTGFQGLPLLEIAKYLVKAKLCTDTLKPCLKCVSCEAVDKDTSVHLKIVKPEGRAIKVDQVRDVISFFSYKRDHTTIVVFDQAHLMNVQAANALLKTLEEPPENCWILLTTPSIKNMLSTIRSRCLVYKAKSFDIHDFKSILPEKTKLSFFQSRWDWILNAEAVSNSLNETEAWLISLDPKEPQLLESMKGRDGLQELIVMLRLLLKSKFQDQLQLNSESVHINSLKWIRIMDVLQNMESALSANVDPKLIEDQLLLALKENHVFH